MLTVYARICKLIITEGILVDMVAFQD